MSSDNVHNLEVPSAWVQRWARALPAGGRVLDLACGGGRHARLLARMGHRVEAVDRDLDALSRLAGVDGVCARAADLEGQPWPFAPASFQGVVVTNYLHRPLLADLVGALAPGGVLIYETFAAGNERYGRPGNPDFLLRPGELLEVVRGRLRVVAFEDGFVAHPRQAMVQRICAVHGAQALTIA